MLIIDNEASLDLALNSPLAPPIKALLRLRVKQIIGEGWTLADLATFIIVEPGDSLSQIEDRLTFPLFTDDAPNWEWIEQHGDLLEAPFILSDDGYGEVLLVPDTDDIDSDLLALIRPHAA